MDLPSLSELNEMNKALLAVLELTKGGKSCSDRAVLNLCSSFVLGGRIIDYRTILKLCSYSGLLAHSKSKVVLTDLGKTFISQNKESRYEITDLQKDLIAEKLILKGPWKSRARDLFNNFDPNYNKITYDLSLIDKPLLPRHNSIMILLHMLNVFEVDNYKYSVTPRYVALVRDLRSDRADISESQLDKALQMNRKLGIQAEEAVLEYEKKRLSSIGCDIHAELVRRISQLDVGAGYDIESFDGDKSLFDYDRFIEVKASMGKDLNFFWSANESSVAKEKRNKYWIYFVANFKQGKGGMITPVMIQNPAKRLTQMSQVRFDVASYHVVQCADITLEPINHGHLKGFIL